MSIKRFLVIILITVFTGVTGAQENEQLPEITPSDVPGGVIIKKNYYDKNTLWGYINGGADIYLEYGLDKVVVEEINWHGQHFKVEVYRMLNPLAAFGIYSVSHGNCNSQDSLDEYSCITAYQSVIFKDKYYISVINETGTEEAGKLSNELSRALTGKIKKGYFRLPELFDLPEFENYKKDVKYFNGILGLQNSLPEMAEQFENFRDYNIFYLPAESNKNYLNLFIIYFSRTGDMSDFLVKNGAKPDDIRYSSYNEPNGLYKSITKLSPDSFIYLESNLNSGTISTYANTINNYVKQIK